MTIIHIVMSTFFSSSVCRKVAVWSVDAILVTAFLSPCSTTQISRWLLFSETVTWWTQRLHSAVLSSVGVHDLTNASEFTLKTITRNRTRDRSHRRRNFNRSLVKILMILKWIRFLCVLFRDRIRAVIPLQNFTYFPHPFLTK